MPIYVKQDAVKFRQLQGNEYTGNYYGIDTISDTTTEEKVAEINNVASSAMNDINNTVTTANSTITNTANSAISNINIASNAAKAQADTLNANVQTIANAIEHAEGNGVDPTLTLPNVAAEAKATGDAIGELKSAFNGSVDSLYMNTVDIVWYQGSIRANGTNASNGACCRTDMLALGGHPVAFLKPGNWLFYIVEYSTNVVSGFTRIITPVYASGNFIFSPVSGYYYRIVVKKQSEADFTPDDPDLANIALTVSESASDIILNVRDGVAIKANDDLNDYVTAGRYISRNTEITRTLFNSPFAGTGFDLIVISTSDRTYGEYVRQIALKNNRDNTVYTRYKTITWGEWQRISMPSGKLAPIQLDDVTIRPLSARNTSSAKLTIKVGTFNVARYNHDTDVYLEDEPQLLLNIRNWLNDINLDILFTQEDTGYINSAKSKTSYDYLYKGFFNADPVNSGDSTDVARANKKIFTTLPISTNGTVVHLDNNANPPAVYPAGHIYEGQTITAYFVWLKQEIANVGTVMLINLHNFYNGGKNSNTEWHPYQNRVLFLDLISTFLASQEYDYCIIAGDFNASNMDGRDASGNYAPIDGKPYGDWDAILDFCEENNLIPCNGGQLEWFKTTDSRAISNILVSNNIRIEQVECDPDIKEALYSDHAPIVARVSFT